MPILVQVMWSMAKIQGGGGGGGASCPQVFLASKYPSLLRVKSAPNISYL